MRLNDIFTCPYHEGTGGYEDCCDCSGDRLCTDNPESDDYAEYRRHRAIELEIREKEERAALRQQRINADREEKERKERKIKLAKYRLEKGLILPQYKERVLKEIEELSSML